jgi:hypothetical protein
MRFAHWVQCYSIEIVHEQLTNTALIFIGAFDAFIFDILKTLQSSEAFGHRILTQWATT